MARPVQQQEQQHGGQEPQHQKQQQGGEHPFPISNGSDCLFSCAFRFSRYFSFCFRRDLPHGITKINGIWRGKYAVASFFILPLYISVSKYAFTEEWRNIHDSQPIDNNLSFRFPLSRRCFANVSFIYCELATMAIPRSPSATFPMRKWRDATIA